MYYLGHFKNPGLIDWLIDWLIFAALLAYFRQLVPRSLSLSYTCPPVTCRVRAGAQENFLRSTERMSKCFVNWANWAQSSRLVNSEASCTQVTHTAHAYVVRVFAKRSCGTYAGVPQPSTTKPPPPYNTIPCDKIFYDKRPCDEIVYDKIFHTTNHRCK